MSTNTFESEFQRRVEDIKARATAVGSSITELCKETKIARATPDRWSARTPKTILLVDQLEEALSAIESEKRAPEQK